MTYLGQSTLMGSNSHEFLAAFRFSNKVRPQTDARARTTHTLCNAAASVAACALRSLARAIKEKCYAFA